MFSKTFIDCMKQHTKEDKCKKEFEKWYDCDKNTYLKEFIEPPTPVIYVPEIGVQTPST